ncbi:hypothetical protein ACOZ4F_10915 [Haloarcula marismortui]|uniref:hypothetical protein n=1 Tax=Haloarcula marismortui TaxID=2238 RepID=UPI003C719EBB
MTFSELEELEAILISLITQPTTNVCLNLDSVTEISRHSVNQLPKENIDSFCVGYSIEVSGDEGTVILSGGASPHESHQIYCNGNPMWINKVDTRVSDYFDERSTYFSELRTRITSEVATALSIFSALSVGYTIVSVTPGNLIHYYPAISDVIIVSVSLSVYLSIRFRDWVFPYIRISDLESVSPLERFKEILYASFTTTILLILIRSIAGPGPIITF